MPSTGKLYFGDKLLGSPDSYWDVLTASATATTVDLSWAAAGGSPSSYEVSIDGSITNVGNVTSFSKTGLTAGTSYQFKVRPVYADGSKGGWSFFKNRSPLGFNAATGGTVTTVSNYNGTGQTWKIHTFRSGGTFTVTNSANPFSVLLVGNGGSGGGGIYGTYAGGGGGGGGGVYTNTSMTLTNTSYSVSVGPTTFNGQTASNGSNGQGSGNGNNGGSSGSPTSYPGGGVYPSSSYSGGGGGGAGGGGGGGNGFDPGGGGPGVSRNISGTALTYGSGGAGGGSAANGAPGKGFPGEQTGGAIIAYRIA